MMTCASYSSAFESRQQSFVLNVNQKFSLQIHISKTSNQPWMNIRRRGWPPWYLHLHLQTLKTCYMTRNSDCFQRVTKGSSRQACCTIMVQRCRYQGKFLSCTHTCQLHIQTRYSRARVTRIWLPFGQWQTR
jgi:hypothetical protein